MDIFGILQALLIKHVQRNYFPVSYKSSECDGWPGLTSSFLLHHSPHLWEEPFVCRMSQLPLCNSWLPPGSACCLIIQGYQWTGRVTYHMLEMIRSKELEIHNNQMIKWLPLAESHDRSDIALRVNAAFALCGLGGGSDVPGCRE